MRLVLAVCALLVAAPAALAREPVISYVDAAGTFRLWDLELGAEVTPPPQVPANFAGFRYGMSLNGRFVAFNDPQRKLHLLDRATNTQLPLPGIDAYANPGALTVSDTGLIGFDDNGNGPALIYDSAARAFADTGLAADNGHRQTRLSGDGRLLATTCNDSNCVDDLDTGADPYVQDLGAKLDTGFPDDPNADEEHPCIDEDGSVVGIDKRASAADMQPDVFLFDRSVSPPQPIAIPGANTAAKPDAFCVLDAAGEYVGFFHDNSEFRVWHLTTGAFETLPPGKEFGTSSHFSAPYVPPAPPSGNGPGTTTDTTRPRARRARMTRRAFRVGRRATAFRFELSEPADVVISIRRRPGGRRLGSLRRADRPAGANRLLWNGRLRGRALRAGRYVAVLVATDAAGNRSVPKRIGFRVLRRRVRG